MEFADDLFDADTVQVKINFEFEQYFQESSPLPMNFVRLRNIVVGINL